MPNKASIYGIILLLCLFLFPSHGYSDSALRSDSLYHVILHSSGTEKLIAYRDFIRSVRNINPSRGIDVSKEALALADSLGNEVLKAEIINEEAVCYRKLNLYDKAFKLHMEALDVFNQLNDSAGIAFTYANIGTVYFFFRQFDKALEYHFKGLLIKEYLNDEPQIAYSQNAIGMVLFEMGEYGRALDFYSSALNIRKKYHQHLEESNVYANLGRVMAKLGRYDEAMEFLEQARDAYLAEGIDYALALVYNQMADLLEQQNKHDEALEKLKEAEMMGLKKNNVTILHYNYKLQQKIYTEKENYKQALEYAEKAEVTKDSLINERRFYEMSEIQVRYETRRVDNENEILRLKVDQQTLRNQYLFVALISTLLLIIAGALIGNVVRNRRKNKRLETYNITLENSVQERTMALKEQVNARDEVLKSLRKSEEKLRVINETSPLGIAVTEKNGKIVFINQRLTEVFGLESEAFHSGEWVKSILIEDRNSMEQFWKHAHQESLETMSTKFRIRHDQKILWVHVKAATMVIDNQFAGLVAVFDNITDRMNFENELIQAKNKAEESDRLKSAFLANMSHEIRTPMNAILGFSDLLSSDEYNEEEKTEFIDMIKSSGRLLLNLINDIIDISKIEAGELKIQKSHFMISKLMENMEQTFRQQLDSNGKQHIQLILKLGADVDGFEIYSDHLRLQQILTNLLSNSMKFTNRGQIEFGVMRIDGNFEFYVRDSGIGIPEEKLEVVFERFRQADDSHTRLYGGTGLGLSITKNLTEMLGGKIWVESLVNKGTVFYFTLPANADLEQKSAPEHKPTSEKVYPDFGGKTILVAEDVDTNFNLLRLMLNKMNAKVLHASNGLIAVDMAANHLPDLVLMDIQMPEMDGKQALLSMRAQNLQMPVVATTAFALMGEEQMYINLGFNAYLSKPLSIERLIDVLKKLLN